MTLDLGRLGDYLGSFLRAAAFWRRAEPVTTPAALARFVETRSKFVSQTTLYGYLKTRAGTRYVQLFEDEVFLQSINISKWEIYFACLSDLTVHAVALAGAQAGAGSDEMRDLARWCHDKATRETKPEEMRPGSTEEACAAFDRRTDETAWPACASGAAAFTSSPHALVEWAPVAPELKAYDAEIVANSLRFKWQSIREELARCLDGAAVLAAWRNEAGQPETDGGATELPQN